MAVRESFRAAYEGRARYFDFSRAFLSEMDGLYREVAGAGGRLEETRLGGLVQDFLNGGGRESLMSYLSEASANRPGGR